MSKPEGDGEWERRENCCSIKRRERRYSVTAARVNAIACEGGIGDQGQADSGRDVYFSFPFLITIRKIVCRDSEHIERPEYKKREFFFLDSARWWRWE